MAGKYTYRLTAEGFAEFQAQLAKLGDAGAAAFDKIKATMPQFADAASKAEARAVAAKQKLEEMARTDFSQLAASLDPVIAKQQQLAEGQATIAKARAVGVIGVQEEANALALLEQKYGSATAGLALFSQGVGKATALLSTLGVGLSLAGLVQFERVIFESTAALDNQAKTVGLNVEQFQAYRAGALTAGAAADTGDAAIQRFTRSLGEHNKAFLELGLSADDLAGGTASSLPKVAEALLRISDATTRARLEVELFGKSGQEVEQLLESWADPAILQHMKDMGLVIDQELTERAHAADRAFELLWQRIKVGSADVLFGGPSAGQKAVKDLLGNPSDIGLGQALPLANSSTQAMAFAQSDAARVNRDMTAFYQATAPAIAAAQKARDEDNKKFLEDQKKLKDDITALWDGYYDREAVKAEKFWDDVDALREKSDQNAIDATERAVAETDALINRLAAEADAKRRSDAEKLADEIAREQQRAADQSEHYWDRMFDNMFQSGSFNFKKLLADMATEAIARPIIVPVLQQFAGAIGLGGLGQTGSGAGGSGGSSAGFSGAGFGNIGSLFSSAGSSSGMFGGLFGSAGSIANGNVGTGLFGFLDGTSNAGAALGGLGGILGGGLLGAGIGGLTSSLTGGNAIGGNIGGAIGGAIGSAILPGIGTILGSLAGGALGGLFGNSKPSNFTAYANFDSNLALTGGVTGDKPNQNTMAQAQQAGQAIATAAQKLKDAGIDVTANITRLQIGQRDASQLVLQSGQKIQVGAVGDVQAAVSGTLNYLLGSASSKDSAIQSVISKYKTNGGVSTANIDQLLADVNNAAAITKALASPAVPHQLTAVEAAMQALTAAFVATSDKARELGLDITAFAQVTRQAFDTDILQSITAIENPLKSALDLWQRDAQARLDAAASIGGDIAQVTRLNNLLHQQAVTQVYGNTVSSLQGLQNGISFGSSSAAAPDQQYFAALTQYNTAKSSALGSFDPNDIASFENAAQTFLPVARNFLGTSERFGALTADVQDTVSQLLSGIDARTTGPDLTPLIQATNDGSAAVVDAVNAVNDSVQAMTAAAADQADQTKQLNASTTAVVNRLARRTWGQ